MPVWQQAKLGDITLDCPKGITRPTPEQRGPNEKFTVLTEGLSKYVDHIFIICTDECDMNIPDEFEDKAGEGVTMYHIKFRSGLFLHKTKKKQKNKCSPRAC